MEFTRIRVEVVDEGAPARLSNLVVESGLLAWIKATRLEDPKCILELAEELCRYLEMTLGTQSRVYSLRYHPWWEWCNLERKGRLEYKVALPLDLKIIFYKIILGQYTYPYFGLKDSRVRKSLFSIIRLWLGYPSTWVVCVITRLGCWDWRRLVQCWELLWQILPKLIDNICYFLLASTQDQNDSIVGKYEIISMRIVNFTKN